MKAFPDTTTEGTGGRRPLGPLFGAVCIGVLLLAGLAFLWPAGFSPGEEMVAQGAEDIAVSQEDTTYPGSDALRFGGGPEVLYVYLRVEDLAAAEDLGAAVGRSGRTSAADRLLGGDGLEVVDGGGALLRESEGGVSGVVKFAVRRASGGRLPAGDYTVEVYTAGGGARGGTVLARKYFVVGR